MRKLPLIHALGWLPCWRCGAAVASGSSFFLALQGAGKPSWSPWSQGSGAWGCAHWHKKQVWQHLTTPKLVSLIPSEVLVPFSKTLSLLAMSFKLWACGIPVLCDGVDRGRNSCVFKKGSWFAVELGYCVQDLMDCVCTHNFMRDKHNFSATSSLKELPSMARQPANPDGTVGFSGTVLMESALWDSKSAFCTWSQCFSDRIMGWYLLSNPLGLSWPQDITHVQITAHSHNKSKHALDGHVLVWPDTGILVWGVDFFFCTWTVLPSMVNVSCQLKHLRILLCFCKTSEFSQTSHFHQASLWWTLFPAMFYYAAGFSLSKWQLAFKTILELRTDTSNHRAADVCKPQQFYSTNSFWEEGFEWCKLFPDFLQQRD